VSLTNGVSAKTPLFRVDDTGLLNQWKTDNDTVLREPPATTKAWPKRCAIVQIVVRQARTTSSGKIESAISLDPRLYAKLGMKNGTIDRKDQTLNQAALQLHEALYLLGYGLGQNTSEKVRRLTTVLLSVNKMNGFAQAALRSALDHPNAPKLVAKYLIDELFVDGFGEFPFVESTPVSAQTKELRQAYLRYEKSQTGGHTGSVRYDEPESFVAAAIIALTQERIEDFYSLLDSDFSSRSTVNLVCGFVTYDFEKIRAKGSADDTFETRAIMEGANAYCQKIGRKGAR
jgi:hypothetical protein